MSCLLRVFVQKDSDFFCLYVSQYCKTVFVNMKCFFSLVILLSVLSNSGLHGQRTIIKGSVTDAETGEPLAFANIIFPNSQTGTTTDYDGKYTIETSRRYSTIEARYVGYDTKAIPVKFGESQIIDFKLSPSQNTLSEVEVRGEKQRYTNKNNPAVELIRKVIENKKYNRKANFDYYEFEKYQKLEFALSNISKGFKEKKLFQNFQFVFDNLDSSRMNGKPLLPVYLKEVSSDVWYRKDPKTVKEIIKGEKFVNFSQFLDDASLSEYFNYLYQDIDLYENNIPLFNVQFLSPIANLAPTFYRFYIMDTVLVDQDSCYRLAFYPRNRADFLFQGDLYITKDTSYAVRKVYMTVNKEIHLNWVKELLIQQKFRKVDSLGYIIEKDEIMADFGISAAKMGLFGLRSASYRNFKFNQPRQESDYKGSGIIEMKGMDERTDSFWVAARHDTLTSSEAEVYSSMDSLQKIPAFRRIMNVATLFLAGYSVLGPVEIGPVNTFYSFNPVEGFRFRLGGRTTPRFSKKFLFETYSAYGFKDKKWKYFVGATFSFNRNSISVFPVKELRLSYQKDTKIPGQELQFIQEDNFLLSFKRGNNNIWLYNEIFKLQFLNEFRNHTSLQLDLKDWKQSPAGDLHYNKVNYQDDSYNIDKLGTFEIGLTLRWAPKEQFYQGKLYRIPLPNKYPIFSLRFGLGMKNVLSGEYNYQSLSAYAFKRIYFSQFGYADVTMEGGKIFGSVPFPLLFIHRANQTYSLQLQSYNLMNFLEFVSDEFVSLNVSQYFNGFIFNRLPLIKKLKWRESFTFKMVYGGIRDENNPELNNTLYKFPQFDNGVASTYSLEKKPYMEASVGIYNIFKFFRVDYVHRLSYLSNPGISKSGIRVRVKFEF